MTYLADYSYPVTPAPETIARLPNAGLTFRLSLILSFATVMIAREILWRIHFPVTQHLISIGMSVGLIVLLGLFALYVPRTQRPIAPRHAFNGRLIIFTG